MDALKHMEYIKKYAIVIVLFFFASSIYGQKPSEKIDSLKHLLEYRQQDTTYIHILNTLSSLYHPKKLDSASLYAQQLFDFGVAEENTEAEIKGLLALANIDRHNMDYPKALAKERKALILAKEKQDFIAIADTYFALGSTYHEQKNELEAIKAFKQCIALRDIHESVDAKTLSVLLVARKYLVQSNYDITLEFLLLMLEDLEDEGILIENRLVLLNWLGGVYKEMGENEKALIYYEKALVINEQRAFHKEHIMVLVNMASIQKLMERYDKSKALLFKALEISEQHYSNGLKLNIIKTLAYVYEAMGDFKNAGLYFERAASLAQETGNSFDIVNSYAGLGAFYLKSGEYDKSKRALEKSKKLFSTIDKPLNRLKLSVELYKNLASVDSAQNNYKSSLIHYKQYVKFKDSFALNQQKQKVSNLELAYEKDKQYAEIQLLTSENELQKLKAKDEKVLRITLIVVGLLLLSLLLVLLNRHLIKTKAFKVITDQKESLEIQKDAITEKNKENELLVQEVHHRVKNNLQIILSLLGSYKNTYKNDANVSEVITESQNKIKSMALIHQNLYNSDSFINISATAYFENLIDNIRSSYGLYPVKNKITIYSDIEESPLRMTIAVPVGLIVNELLTNAFKYAFKPEQEDKKITISFGKNAEKNTYYLEIHDNGMGLPPENLDMEKASSFGLQMVYGLIEQLDGKIDISNKDGLAYNIYIQDEDKEVA